MNEVRATQATTPVVTSAASSQGVDVAKKLPDGNNVPVNKATELPPEPETETEPVDIKQAVAEINDFVQNIQRDLHFSVDDDAGMTVIKVLDRGTGDLIRQIPEDVFLNLARNLRENEPINLVNAHG